jgi:hypothetical protein
VRIPQECPFRKGVVGFVGAPASPSRVSALVVRGVRDRRIRRMDGICGPCVACLGLPGKLVQESAFGDGRFARLGLRRPVGWHGHCPASGVDVMDQIFVRTTGLRVGAGIPYRHCLSWDFRHILEDRAHG